MVTALSGTGVASAATVPAERVSGLPTGSAYVALGDSYAAGYGLSHATRQPVRACGQTADDYPHRIAKRLGLKLTDVTCAGATTADVTNRSQFRGAAPQVSALGRSTRLVTLTIGGNDSDLFSTAASCLALTSSGPVFSGKNAPSCRSRLVEHGVDSLRQKIDGQTAAGIGRAIAAVQRHAPNARIVVVGYPAIFPNAAHTPKHGCFRSAFDAASIAGVFPTNSFPFTRTDVKYLNGVQRDLDRVTARAADRAGVQYVSTFRATESRSACSTKDALVSGVSFTASANLAHIDLDAGALHPNERGAAYLARRTVTALQ
jgi:lysophospholipase L1-like esterase